MDLFERDEITGVLVYKQVFFIFRYIGVCGF